MTAALSPIAKALSDLLHGRPPTSLEGIAAIYGASPRTQNPAMAREMAGLAATGRLPARGTEGRRHYETAMRNLQRYRASEGRQRRRPGSATLERLRAGAAARLTERNIERARDEGLMMRLRAWIKVSRKAQVSTMPADIGGSPRFQWIAPQLLGRTLVEFGRGEYEDAADELLGAFFLAYWGTEDPLAEAPQEIVFCQLRFP